MSAPVANIRPKHDTIIVDDAAVFWRARVRGPVMAGIVMPHGGTASGTTGFGHPTPEDHQDSVARGQRMPFARAEDKRLIKHTYDTGPRSIADGITARFYGGKTHRGIVLKSVNRRQSCRSTRLSICTSFDLLICCVHKGRFGAPRNP